MSALPDDILDPDQAKRLSQYAKATGLSVRALIRKAVAEFLQKDATTDYGLLAAQERALMTVWDNDDDAIYDEL